MLLLIILFRLAVAFDGKGSQRQGMSDDPGSLRAMPFFFFFFFRTTGCLFSKYFVSLPLRAVCQPAVQQGVWAAGAESARAHAAHDRRQAHGAPSGSLARYGPGVCVCVCVCVCV